MMGSDSSLIIRIVRYEGAKRTFRGISAVVAGAGPAHAMYFACYEWIKKSLSTANSSNHLVHGKCNFVTIVNSIRSPV